MPKQLGAPTHDVVHANDARTGDLSKRLSEQLFTVLDRTAAQMVTIEVQEGRTRNRRADPLGAE
jgi:hypothetical protein